MSYTPTERDIRLIRQAAALLGTEAEALFVCSTVDGEFSDGESSAQEDYQTMRTIQARLTELASRMKA